MSCRRPRTQPVPRNIVLAAVLTILSGFPGPASFARDGEGLPDSNPTSRLDAARIQAIFVPQERIIDIAPRAIPIPRREFADLVREAREHSLSHPPIVAAIRGIRYEARFEPPRTMRGTVQVDLGLWDAPKSICRVGPWPLNVVHPVFLEGQRVPRPLNIAGDGQGGLMLPTEGPGEAQWEWSWRGNPVGDDEVSFQAPFPIAARQRFRIQHPAEYSVHVPNGVALERREDPRGSVASTFRATGALPEFRISKSKIALLPPEFLVAEQHQHLLSLAGIESRFTFRLSSFVSPPQEVILTPYSTQTVREVLVDHRSVPWNMRVTATGAREVVVELPPAIHVQPISLEVRTEEALALESEIVLPRCFLEGGTWQEGTTVVRAIPPLRIHDWRGTANERARLEFVDPHREGDRLTIEHAGPRPTLRVEASEETAVVTQSSEEVLTVGATALRLESRIEIQCQSGRLFEWICGFDRPWVVDSVETEDAEEIHDWRIDTSSNTSRLRIQLRDPIQPGDPRTFVVRSRAPGFGDSDQIPAETLRALRLEPSITRAWWRDVVADPPYRVSILEGPTSSIPPTPTEAAVSSSTPEANPLRLRYSPITAPLARLVLRRETPGWSGNIVVQGQWQGDQLRETATIELSSTLGEARNVEIAVVPRDDPPFEWALVGPAPLPLIAMPVPKSSDAAVSPSARWNLALPPSSNGAWRIQGTRARSIDPRRRNDIFMSLVSIPDAREHAALVTAVVLGSSEWWPRGGLPRALADDSSRHDSISFVYDQNVQDDPIAHPRWTRETPGSANLWARELRTLGTWSPSGTCRQQSVFQLELRGPATLKLDAPPNVRWLGGRFAGRELSPDACAAPLVLDGAASRVELELNYEVKGVSGKLWSPLRLWVPELGLTVLSRRDRLRYPAGFVATGAMVSPGDEARQTKQPGDGWRPMAILSNSLDGWRTDFAGPAEITEIELRGRTPGIIYLFPRGTLLGLAWGLGLLAFSVARLWPRVRGWTACTLMAIIACWWCSAPFSWIASGIATGLFCAFPAALGRQRPSAAALTAFLVAILVTPATGAEPARAAAPLRVWVPMERNRQPYGDYVYLSPNTFRDLLRLANKDRDALQALPLVSARYDAEVSMSPDGPRLTRLEGTIRWVPPTPPGNQTLLLPGLELDAGAPYVDIAGRRIAVALDPTIAGCRADLSPEASQIGACRVRIPVERLRLDDRRECTVSIPAIPSSELRITLPPDLDPPDVLSTRGESRFTSIHPMLQAELGNTGRIHLRFAPWITVSPEDFVTREEIDVYPGSGTTRFHVTWICPRTPHVGMRLMVPLDSRLQPFREDDDSVDWFPLGSRGVRETDVVTRYALIPRGHGQSNLELDLVSTGNGITALRLPVSRSESSTRPSVPTVVRVHPHEGTVCELSADADPLRPTRPSPDGSVVTYHLSPQSQSQLNIRPSESRIGYSIDESIDCHSDHLDLRWSLDIDPQGQSISRHRLRLGPQVQITSLEADVEGSSLPIRWSPTRSGGMTLLFGTSVRDRHRVVVRGKLNSSLESTQEIPRIGLSDLPPVPCQVEIRSARDVSVEILGPAAVLPLSWSGVRGPVPPPSDPWLTHRGIVEPGEVLRLLVHEKPGDPAILASSRIEVASFPAFTPLTGFSLEVGATGMPTPRTEPDIQARRRARVPVEQIEVSTDDEGALITTSWWFPACDLRAPAIELPPGTLPLAMTIDGAPLAFIAEENGRVRLDDLRVDGPSELVLIAHQAWDSPAKKNGMIVAPRILGSPADRLLWHVRSRGKDRGVVPSGEMVRLNRGDFAWESGSALLVMARAGAPFWNNATARGTLPSLRAWQTRAAVVPSEYWRLVGPSGIQDTDAVDDRWTPLLLDLRMLLRLDEQMVPLAARPPDRPRTGELFFASTSETAGLVVRAAPVPDPRHSDSTFVLGVWIFAVLALAWVSPRFVLAGK